MGTNMLAICDGVGGWSSKGVDVALYSKQLMNNINTEYAIDPSATPKELLGRAGEKCTEIGSSTAVVVTLNSDQAFMNTTNLGDSGYMILRPDPKLKIL